MSPPPFPRRPHLVERAADAARAAIAADTPLARTPRPPLMPVELIPTPAEPVPPAVSRSLPTGLPGRDEAAAVTCALLRRAGLVSMAGRAWEEIALVREQLLRSVETMPSDKERQARMVLITSARSGEGTSFAALNLAASIAGGAHRRVILVDASRGATSLSSLLGLADAPGLDQLHEEGGPDPAGLLQRTEIPDLSVLPHGTIAPSGTQGNARAALLRLAERLPEHLILLDAAACLESSIAGLLAAAAGQVVLVVEAERTKRAEVEAALDILDACPTMQLLLNRSALRVSDRFRGPVTHAGDVAVGAHQT